jgi:hypothetical protein
MDSEVANPPRKSAGKREDARFRTGTRVGRRRDGAQNMTKWLIEASLEGEAACRR